MNIKLTPKQLKETNRLMKSKTACCVCSAAMPRGSVPRFMAIQPFSKANQSLKGNLVVSVFCSQCGEEINRKIDNIRTKSRRKK